MSINVRIFTKEEREDYWARPGKESVADLATFYPEEIKTGPIGGTYIEPARFRLQFAKPQSNLITAKDWGLMLAQAVAGCKRKGSINRGLSKDEFESLLVARELCTPTRSDNGTLLWTRTEIRAVCRHLGWTLSININSYAW